MWGHCLCRKTIKILLKSVLLNTRNLKANLVDKSVEQKTLVTDLETRFKGNEFKRNMSGATEKQGGNKDAWENNFFLPRAGSFPLFVKRENSN